MCPALGYRLKGTVKQTPTSFVLDTGAAATLLRLDQMETTQLKPWDRANLISANGSQTTVHGTVTVILNFTGVNFPTQVVVDRLTAEAMLGLDFLEAHECTYHSYQEEAANATQA